MKTGAELPDFDVLWDYSDPAATEQRFRALLPVAERSEVRGYLAELLTQIARTEGLQGRFEDAHRTLDHVETLSLSSLPRARIRYHLERGRVFNSSGNPEQSRDLFLRAWELGGEHGEEFYAVDAAHMMGIVERPESQIEWNKRALAHAETSDDGRVQGWRGSLYNNLGWSYFEMGQFNTALEYFQRGLEWRTQEGKAQETRIAAWTVARALRALHRCEEALPMQRENLEQILEAEEPGGFINEEIAENLLELGRREEARSHFARAYEILSGDSWLVEHEPDRLRRLGELAGHSTL